jgi:hypothetical protein
MVGVPLPLNVVLLVVAILGGVLEYRRLAARGITLTLDRVVSPAPSLAVGVPLVGLSLLGVLLVHACTSLPWHLPLWWTYYDMVLMWGTLLALCAFVCGLVGAVAFATQHRARWPVGLSGALVLVTLHGVQWYYSQPVTTSLRHITTSDGVILQSSGESCAAAAGANLVRALGMQKTEREMAGLFGTTKFLGTSHAQVVYGMQALGLVAARAVQLPSADPAQLPGLAMLFVDYPATGRESHAVAFMGFAAGKAEIWDSLVGKRWLDKDQLAQIWHGRGVVVTR